MQLKDTTEGKKRKGKFLKAENINDRLIEFKQ